MFTIKKDRILTDVFDNINEYVKFLENPINKKPSRNNSSEEDGRSFSGTGSYQEAKELLQYGDDETLEKIKKIQKELKIDKLLGNNINKKKSYMDVVGYQPCVPLFLNGVPKCMITDEKRKVDFKILNIYLNICASAYVKAEQLQRAGAIHAMILDILEKKGYRINLFAGNVSELNGEILMPCVKIKTDREPLNLKKLAFCIAHPSMLRRIGFKYMEVCDSNDDFTHSGYGRPEANEDKIRKILNDRFKTDFIVFSYQNLDYDFDIKKMIEKIKEKGIYIDMEGLDED